MKNSQLTLFINTLNAISLPNDIDLAFKLADISEEFMAEHAKLGVIQKTLMLTEKERKLAIKINQIEESSESQTEKAIAIIEAKYNAGESVSLQMSKKTNDLQNLLNSELRKDFKHGYLTAKEFDKVKKSKSIKGLSIGELTLFKVLLKK